MIAAILKHYIYDIGLSMFMDNVISNFRVYIPSQYIGNYWEVYDEDDDLVAFGVCTNHEGGLILLDDGSDAEYVVHTDLYKLVESSKIECDNLNIISDINDEMLIEYLKQMD